MKILNTEDTILMKLRWAKLSGGSEKQFTDALRSCLKMILQFPIWHGGPPPFGSPRTA